MTTCDSSNNINELTLDAVSQLVVFSWFILTESKARAAALIKRVHEGVEDQVRGQQLKKANDKTKKGKPNNDDATAASLALFA